MKQHRVFIIALILFLALANPASAQAPTFIDLKQGDLFVLTCDGEFGSFPLLGGNNKIMLVVTCAHVVLKATPPATPPPIPDTSTPTPATPTPSDTPPPDTTSTPTLTPSLTPTPTQTPTQTPTKVPTPNLTTL